METYSTSCKLWNLSKLQKMENIPVKGKVPEMQKWHLC